jgi:hypothetical protein
VVIVYVKRHRQVSAILKLIRETIPKHFPECQPIIEGPESVGDSAGD